MTLLSGYCNKLNINSGLNKLRFYLNSVFDLNPKVLLNTEPNIESLVNELSKRASSITHPRWRASVRSRNICSLKILSRSRPCLGVSIRPSRCIQTKLLPEASSPPNAKGYAIDRAKTGQNNVNIDFISIYCDGQKLPVLIFH